MSSNESENFEDKRVFVRDRINELEDFLKRSLEERINYCWRKTILDRMGEIQRKSVDLPKEYENKEEYKSIEETNTKVQKQFEELTVFFVDYLQPIDPEIKKQILKFIDNAKTLFSL